MSKTCCVENCSSRGDTKVLRGSAMLPVGLYICSRHWGQFFGHAAKKPAEVKGPGMWVCQDCGFGLAYTAETRQWCNVCWAVRQGGWKRDAKPAEGSISEVWCSDECCSQSIVEILHEQTVALHEQAILWQREHADRLAARELLQQVLSAELPSYLREDVGKFLATGPAPLRDQHGLWRGCAGYWPMWEGASGDTVEAECAYLKAENAPLVAALAEAKTDAAMLQTRVKTAQAKNACLETLLWRSRMAGCWCTRQERDLPGHSGLCWDIQEALADAATLKGD